MTEITRSESVIMGREFLSEFLVCAGQGSRVVHQCGKRWSVRLFSPVDWIHRSELRVSVKVWNHSFCLQAAVALLACLGACGSDKLSAIGGFFTFHQVAFHVYDGKH